MAYTYDPSTVVGLIRLNIGDLVDANGTAFFTDEELTTIYAQQSNDVGKASISALRIWARRLASQPKVQIGDYTIDPATTAKNLMSAADALALELDDETDDPIFGEIAGEFFVRGI
jgi:hypothetical protein